VLKDNLRHCETRNKFYLEEVRNAWKKGISNRQIVLRSLARTNSIKRDADEWISRMEDGGLGVYENVGSFENSELS
jgi:hypothetical protein